jgi:hypothetical protein
MRGSTKENYKLIKSKEIINPNTNLPRNVKEDIT